jgi:hypothetical protein
MCYNEIMNPATNSEIFFYVSSIGFVLLWVLTAVLLFYAIRATRAFGRIMESVEEDIDSLGDTTKEMLDDVRESAIFNFIFRKRKRSKR